jgi:hypothetical protein
MFTLEIAMKKQTYGDSTPCGGHTRHYALGVCGGVATNCMQQTKDNAVRNYHAARDNGEDIDSPLNRPFPTNDGRYTWIQRQDQAYEIRYEQSKSGKIWQEDRDKRYSARVELIRLILSEEASMPKELILITFSFLIKGVSIIDAGLSTNRCSLYSGSMQALASTTTSAISSTSTEKTASTNIRT